RRDVAIVDAVAGTTRDVREVHLDLGGYPVTVADTAGLRDGAEAVEREGIRRAEARAAEADIRLAVFDAAAGPAALAGFAGRLVAPSLVAVNKIDAAAPDLAAWAGDHPALGISVKTGAGIDALLTALTAAVAAGFEAERPPVVTRARHREALRDCAAALEGFSARSDRLARPELGAEDLRLASRALGRITGRVDVEDLLDVIFADFCIGK
ncbi:MAG: GTPase, partial [Rhodospirillaceae bacterium]